MIKIDLPTNVSYILNRLHQADFEAYIVGGCVRDSLLGRIPHDWDITTNALPKQVEEVFKDKEFIETGLKHGTVTLHIDKDNDYEITTYRIDGSYSDNRHPDKVTFTPNLKEDLSRRDFTINAMAYNDEEGLIDEFGGVQDLQNKIIKCVGRPYVRFNEDALRMLRALRFAAQLGFSIEFHITDSIRRQEKLILNISRERITEEFRKLICSDGKVVINILDEYSRFFAVICPPLYDMFEFGQNSKYHYQDVWHHTLNVLEHTKPDYETRMAALFHDIGKPASYVEDDKGQGHFYGHPQKSFEIFEDICDKKYLVFSNEERENIGILIHYHDYNIFTPSVKAVKRFILRIKSENFYKMMDLKVADRDAHAHLNKDIFKAEEIEKIFEQIQSTKDCYKLKDLAIKGKDILALGYTGVDVGRILHSCLDLVINESISNELPPLLEYAKSEKWRKNYKDSVADNWYPVADNPK